VEPLQALVLNLLSKVAHLVIQVVIDLQVLLGQPHGPASASCQISERPVLLVKEVLLSDTGPTQVLQLPNLLVGPRVEVPRSLQVLHRVRCALLLVLLLGLLHGIAHG